MCAHVKSSNIRRYQIDMRRAFKLRVCLSIKQNSISCPKSAYVYKKTIHMLWMLSVIGFSYDFSNYLSQAMCFFEKISVLRLIHFARTTKFCSCHTRSPKKSVKFKEKARIKNPNSIEINYVPIEHSAKFSIQNSTFRRSRPTKPKWRFSSDKLEHPSQ